MSNYVKRAAIYKGQDDVVYENHVRNSISEINKLPLVSTEETRRALILESFGDFDKESAPVSKEEYRRQLGESAKPEVVDLFAPLCAGDVAERNFKQCVKEIDQAIEDSLKEYHAVWEFSKYVNSEHAIQLKEIYENRGFVVRVIHEIAKDIVTFSLLLKEPKTKMMWLSEEKTRILRRLYQEMDDYEEENSTRTGIIPRDPVLIPITSAAAEIDEQNTLEERFQAIKARYADREEDEEK